MCSHPSNMAAIIRAFEDAGVIFTDTGTGGGPGVRLRERPAPIEWSGGDVSLGLGAVPA